jgi:AraC-like DNA-binding protein
MYRFVPDGYVDWVFHKGNPWQCDFPDVSSHPKTGEFHVFGQLKTYINLSLPSTNLNVFAVKFHPWVANKIWNVDMYYLTNSCMDLQALELPFINGLHERICLAENVKEQIKHVEVYLDGNVKSNIDLSLKHIFTQLHKDTNQLNLNNLGIGVRRLEQRFKNEIGITPKLLYRTHRINTVIEQLKNNAEQSLTQLALANNYFDQSHLIRDFKQFTGFNPTKFLKSIDPNGDILNLRVS